VTLKVRQAARFFFLHLTEKGDRFVEDSEEFEFYLSAFLSAGRSVTFALQAEEKARYDSWYPGWERILAESERELFQFMNDQRVAEIHRGGADVQSEARMVPITEVVERSPRTHPAYGFHWWAPPRTPPPAIGKRIRFFELDGTREEVIATGDRYLKLLERLVEEFDQAFPGE